MLRVAVSSGCLISATLIRSQANSSATASARSSNATGTQFVNLVVAGIPIAGTPPPNTTITLPLGLGFVVLNEQVPDGPETGHTGLTVRGLRAVDNAAARPAARGRRGHRHGGAQRRDVPLSPCGGRASPAGRPTGRPVGSTLLT